MTPRRNLILALAVAAAGLVAIARYGPEAGQRIVRELPPFDIHGMLGLRSERDWQEIAEAIGVQARHEDRLLSIPGVTAIGVGRWNWQRPAIHVFAERGAPVELPSSIEGVPVVLREGGPFYALQEATQEGAARTPGAPYGAPGASYRAPTPLALPDRWAGSVLADPAADSRADSEIDRKVRFTRPVPIGVSTGHPGGTAGTIGALVTDGARLYALSNYHVYVVGSNAQIGDPLLQPGAYDGGAAPGDAIGTLAAFEPISFNLFGNNRVDAALALTTDVDHRTPSDGYGAPRSEPLDAVPGLKVQKYGRTTGHTFGEVDAINATVNVRYANDVARFTGQVIFCCEMSAGGDSGSLIVAHDVDEEGSEGEDDRRPVALLFAGDGSLTIGNPIAQVLDAFGVRIVGDGDR